MANQKPKQIKCYCGHTTMCDCGEEPKPPTKMTYKNYIDLGFSRCEMDCGVTFDETGYGGFVLTKRTFHKKMMIEVCGDELNSPKLYIRKGNGDSYHIFKITPEAVKDLLNNNMPPVLEQKCVVPNCKKEPIQGAFHGLCSQHIWPNG